MALAGGGMMHEPVDRDLHLWVVTVPREYLMSISLSHWRSINHMVCPMLLIFPFTLWSSRKNPESNGYRTDIRGIHSLQWTRHRNVRPNTRSALKACVPFIQRLTCEGQLPISWFSSRSTGLVMIISYPLSSYCPVAPTSTWLLPRAPF